VIRELSLSAAPANGYNGFAQILRRIERMKRPGWILLLLLLACPAWGARKITVVQLQDLLQSLKQADKTDAEVGAELEQVELTEELTKSAMDSLASFVPGPLTSNQIYVLEARNALLAPPAADLPSTPAPDAAGQKALLDKAIDYATKTYAQLPHVTATKTTFRFQDHVPPADDQVFHYIGSIDAQVEIRGGAEVPTTVKDTTKWGANNQIAIVGQGPVLTTALQEAQAVGKINWLRWETLYGRQTAVFSFAVDKKKSHYAVNYCCFPNADQGSMNLVNAGLQPGTAGNMQDGMTWTPYKATVPYHGELFVDSETGTVTRLITVADFRPFDTVHQEDTRIDYSTVNVGGKSLILPVRTIIDTEDFPTGSPVGKRIVRRTLFTSEIKDYK
jgi:hypothetical protein